MFSPLMFKGLVSMLIENDCFDFLSTSNPHTTFLLPPHGGGWDVQVVMHITKLESARGEKFCKMPLLYVHVLFSYKRSPTYDQSNPFA